MVPFPGLFLTYFPPGAILILLKLAFKKGFKQLSLL